jgi:hypothetical protein
MKLDLCAPDGVPILVLSNGTDAQDVSQNYHGLPYNAVLHTYAVGVRTLASGRGIRGRLTAVDTSARAILRRPLQCVESVQATFQRCLNSKETSPRCCIYQNSERTSKSNLYDNNTRKYQDNGHLSMTRSLSIWQIWQHVLIKKALLSSKNNSEHPKLLSDVN